MIKFNYTITLKSDAEIAMGFGSGLLDAIAPRNLQGNFVIPASHVKGLIRQSLLDVMDILPEQGKRACDKMLGRAGECVDVGGMIAITEAVSQKCNSVMVTRTAINKFGTADKGTLRSTEAVPVGTEFKGVVMLDAPAGSGFETLLKFALLSIMELGGSRSRGCGACIVTIDGENANPGDLLLRAVDANYDLSTVVTNVNKGGDPQKRVLVRLELKTNSPICVPELPVVGNNTICSGWNIPASAVQGILLTRINTVNPEVATACFNSPLFRTWPLQPVPEECCDSVPVRASASHKISKLAVGDKYNFCDETLKKYKWKDAPANAPIKSADGVLLLDKEKKVMLWRSGDMARYLSAHGVINGESDEGTKRNMFTVQSVAERLFVGFASMPEDAYKLLQDSLNEDNMVLVGKARNVRGNGMLKVSEPLSEFPISLPEVEEGEEPYKQVVTKAAFIVQSPVLLPETIDRNLSAAEMLKAVVRDSGWGDVEECSASVQVLFGWNRTKNGRQKAELVIAPGSVFLLKSIPENWQDLLLKGLGDGRDRGYGAVLPHPGVAQARFRQEEKLLPEVKSSGNYACVAWNLWSKSKGHLSSSQISRLLALVSQSVAQARRFLERQRLDRGTKFWDAWKPVYKDLFGENGTGGLVERSDAAEIFKVWYDLTVATTVEGK